MLTDKYNYRNIMSKLGTYKIKIQIKIYNYNHNNNHSPNTNNNYDQSSAWSSTSLLSVLLK